MSEQTAVRLGRLAPETWGQRFQRVRPRKVTAESLVEHVSKYVLTSTTMIRNIEELHDAPPSTGRYRNRRAVAAIVCVTFGIDPEDLQLSLEDIPEGVRAKVLDDARNPGPGGPGALGVYPPWDSNPEPAD